MKKNEKKYNAIDFARYHSGAMPPDEMQVLERAALEDPFLADALDGYIYSKDSEKETDEIKMRLEEKRNQKKIFSISSLSSGAWWKIAAMFILFAGAGYFFYASHSKKENSLSVKKDIPKNESPAITSGVNSDTSASEGNIAFEKTNAAKDKNNLAKLPAPVLKPLQPEVKNSDNANERMKEKKIISEKQLAAKNENVMAMNTGKINQADITAIESKEKSFYSSTDTTVSVAVSSNVSSGDSDNMVAMNKKSAALSEVVVTGYGTQRKKSITGASSEKLEGKLSGVNITTPAPYPKEGKEKFDQYITDNAVPVFDSTGTRIRSNVLLSFTLNKKRKPAHIKVLESSCEACEKEATRLLENGPGWIGKRGDSATVRIQF